MSKVGFSRSGRRLDYRHYGTHHGHGFIGCDLARPAAELRAIGALMGSLPWIGSTMVTDGVLYVHDDYDVSFELQERALHRALGLARTVLAEGLAVIATERLKPAPGTERNDDVYCSRPSTYVRSATDPKRSSKYAVAKDCYEPTMMVVERDGRLLGHFLVSERYDDARRDLAMHMLEMVMPEAGVEIADREVLEELYLERRPDGIEDLGAACLRVGQGMIAAMKDRMNRLRHEGRPSAFLDEDDDARDVLLELMARGATLTWSREKDRGRDFSDVEDGTRYHLDDGSEAPYHVVQRLCEARLIQPADGPWGKSTTMVAVEGLTDRQLKPRGKTVSFDMFQSACRFRRHPDDGERECLSQKRHGYHSYCEAESCPLLDRVYENELSDGIYSRGSITRDPAFDHHELGEVPDYAMTARHSSTMRSYAWRHAGESRMHGILNRVLGAHLTYGIPLLVEAMHEAAVDQAVAEGWVVVSERNDL